MDKKQNKVRRAYICPIANLLITRNIVIYITILIVTRFADMENPFKFGTIVQEPYFTDRREEFKLICEIINSPNHLILISPRRFGKSSLIKKVLSNVERPSIFINVQQADSVADLARLIVRETLKSLPLERIKHFLKNFRIVPIISVNPMTNGVDVSFSASANASTLLEDALGLIESIGDEKRRLIVVFDEFQEIMQLDKGIDKKLRAIMQEQRNVNFVFLGSQESMMTEIFEKVKSPFYHFGQLMYLKKIPYEDFLAYLVNGFQAINKVNPESLANDILAITACHPYYTQQLAACVWDMLTYDKLKDSSNPAQAAMEHLVAIHDLDYERLWVTFPRTNRRVLKELAASAKLSDNNQFATSTTYSAVSRLMKSGYVIKTDSFEIEDPIFKKWINERQN